MKLLLIIGFLIFVIIILTIILLYKYNIKKKPSNTTKNPVDNFYIDFYNYIKNNSYGSENCIPCLYQNLKNKSKYNYSDFKSYLEKINQNNVISDVNLDENNMNFYMDLLKYSDECKCPK
jgi:hypothetical protein